MIKAFNELTTTELYEILRLRSEIFVVEQTCVYQDLEGDIDYRSFHVFHMEDGKCVAYLRCFWRDEEQKVAQIGRVVTLEHGKGWGGRILKEGIDFCVNVFKAQSIYLEAQCYALGYYEKYGFKVISDELMIDGIPHKKMMYVV